MRPGFVIAFSFAGILLYASLIFFLYWYDKKSKCDQHPSYWCFNDWTCSGETEERYKYPAKYLYCGVDCDDPSYKDHPACKCKIGNTKNNCLPRECSCNWAGNQGELNLGDFGAKYCSGASVAL